MWILTVILITIMLLANIQILFATWLQALLYVFHIQSYLTLTTALLPPSPMDEEQQLPKSEQLAQGLREEPGFAHRWHILFSNSVHTHNMTFGTSITKKMKGPETFSPSIPGAPGNPSSPWKGIDSKRGYGVPWPPRGICRLSSCS